MERATNWDLGPFNSSDASDDPFGDLMAGFLDHYESVRGVVRKEMVAKQLGVHLPSAPARVIDVGGGAGQQSILLARLGYEAVILDPSHAMLKEAMDSLASEPAEVRHRVSIHKGYAADALSQFGEGSFDAVLCHGVLMYVEDPAAVIANVVRLVRDGGMVSLLTKNKSSLAMRPGLEGRYADAVSAFLSDRSRGRLGTVTRGDTLQDLADFLRLAGAKLLDWYGVRVFCDHIADMPPGTDLGDLLEAEWHAGQTDPYRQVGRLLHVVANRDFGS